jgi:hypothetical protein
MISRLATFAAIAVICVAGASGGLAAPKKKAEPKAEQAPATTTATGAPVFPNAIDPKYSKESPGKGREHTCLDQYKANKAKNANGGLKWIQKGGGYYSECNKHLKG